MSTATDKATKLSHFYKKYTQCAICPMEALGSSRIVYGHGDPNSPLMFIGEAPGEEEDRLGMPFVGRSGKLFTAALIKGGMQRSDVFITNVLKCRPPKNRAPLPEEMINAKSLILDKEIEIIQPKVICTLGSSATNTILEKPVKITQARGATYLKNGYLVIPTYHPAYILRNQAALPTFEEDIQKAISLAKRHSS